MTRGGRRRAARAMTCLSCGALLDDARSFCDDACKAFAATHGYGHYGDPKGARGLPHDASKVRRAYRRR